MNNTYLIHHGILGQKWGIRRYQNPDGTLTAEGKKRQKENYEYDPEEKKEKRNSALKKVAIGAVSSAAIAGAGYLYATNPKVKESVDKFMKESGKKAVNRVKRGAERAGEKMVDAALASIGTIAISKIAKKLETNDKADQALKDRNKVILDTTSAGIRAFTNSNGGGNNNNNNNKNTNHSNGQISEDTKKRLGEPANDGQNANQHPEWGSLIGNLPPEVKSEARELARAGYSIDQIRFFVSDTESGIVKHLDDYSDVYIGTNFIVRKKVF